MSRDEGKITKQEFNPGLKAEYEGIIKNVILKNLIAKPTSGSGTRYSADIPVPGHSSYFESMEVLFIPDVAGAASPVINLNSWGDIPIKIEERIPEAGEIKAGVPLKLVYYSGSFTVLGKGGGASLDVHIIDSTTAVKNMMSEADARYVDYKYGYGWGYSSTRYVELPVPANCDKLLVIQVGNAFGIRMNYKGITLNYQWSCTRNDSTICSYGAGTITVSSGNIVNMNLGREGIDVVSPNNVIGYRVAYA